MKSIWDNVRFDNSLVKSREKVFSKDYLFTVFESSVSCGNWNFVRWINRKVAPYECILSNQSSTITVLLYLKNITNAGWESKPFIKRVQVSNPTILNLDFNRYDNSEKISLILGYYNYEKPIFVSWDAFEFRRHKTNRSCYVEVSDLIEGYNNGFLKTKSSGQDITLFTPDNFELFLNDFMDNVECSLNAISDKLYEICMDYYKVISKFDSYWDGKDKVTEMKNGGSSNWKQTEWPGFYFEFLMEDILGKDKFMKVTFDKTTFDMFDYIPWDLKVHSVNSSSPNKIIANDLESIYQSIEKYGRQGFIILEGFAEYELDGEFREWINELKGGLSPYQKRNIENNKKKRKRKSGFQLQDIIMVVIDKDDIEKHPQFQKGFINSNNTTRKSKLMIDKSKLSEKNILLKKSLKD